MAISKITCMKDCGKSYHGKHLRAALAYITVPEKTQQGRLVAGINCVPEFAFEQMKDTKRKYGKLDKLFAEKTALISESGFGFRKSYQNLPREPEFSVLGIYSSRLPGMRGAGLAVEDPPSGEGTAHRAPDRALEGQLPRRNGSDGGENGTGMRAVLFYMFPGVGGRGDEIRLHGKLLFDPFYPERCHRQRSGACFAFGISSAEGKRLLFHLVQRHAEHDCGFPAAGFLHGPGLYRDGFSSPLHFGGKGGALPAESAQSIHKREWNVSLSLVISPDAAAFQRKRVDFLHH